MCRIPIYFNAINRVLISQLLVSFFFAPLSFSNECPQPYLRILGSGGPDHAEGRRSSGNLLVIDDRQWLIDAGPGVAPQIGRFGKIENLRSVLLTHLHVDHASDVIGLIKQSYFAEVYQQPISIYGPTGNQWLPDTEGWLALQVKQVYPYLADMVTNTDPQSPSAIWQAKNLVPTDKVKRIVSGNPSVSYISVPHGPLLSVAYRFDINWQDKKLAIVVSGDTSATDSQLAALLTSAPDYPLWFIAHHAIPEQSSSVARNLHMPPSAIGRLAARANTHRVILTHRMQRTLGNETFSLNQINEHYRGVVDFAHDGQCFPLFSD